MLRHLEPFQSAEDYLDWVENHRRPRPEMARLDATLLAASFLGTSVWLAAATAAIGFFGPVTRLRHLFHV